MIGFDKGETESAMLDGNSVSSINSDLTSTSDLTTALSLKENFDLSYVGPSPHGSFDIDSNTAKAMLSDQSNVNNRPNSDVIRPVISSIDIGQKPRNMWTIDFGVMSLEQAAKYEKPFEYVKKLIYPIRSKNRRAAYAEKWWQYAEARPGMRSALMGKSRYIATPRVSKYRIFIWLSANVLSNDGTIVFARDDDYFFGILHSKIHELWARATGTQLREAESGFRYTPSSTFETFPFPWAPGAEPVDDPRVKSIAQSAKELVEQRDRWLNAEGLTEAEKKKRTLTNLYNARPTWLDLAHKRLDAAVFAAYGWKSDLSDEEILEKLLALNLERG